MKRRLAIVFPLLALAGLAGCQSGSTSGYRRSAARPVEPGLAMAGESGEPGTIVEKPPRPPRAEWVDRHPLFTRPREVYESSGNNRVVKVAGATIVGIPMGIAGELRQIVVGSPPATRGF